MNTQNLTGKILPVAEEFYSVQGEGVNAGTAAYFVRLGGCDVHCPWCDSKETWDAEKFQETSVEDIARRASETPCCNVVVTGGEPLMYNLYPLSENLEKQCLSIWLETSGTHPLTGNFDWITVSPKKNKPPLDEVLECANELKMIISNGESLLEAEKYAKKVPAGCALLLQAEWNNFEKANALIFDYVLKHPVWKISLQTHKILKIK
jgi:organic radical activating enzyme